MLFVILIIVVYFLINTWLCYWFWKSLCGSKWRIPAVALTAILALLYPVLFRMHGTSSLELSLLTVGALWAGIVLYVFAFVLVADLIHLITRKSKASKDKGKEQGKRKRKSKTKQPILPMCEPRYKACIVVAGLSLIVGLGGWYNANYPILTEYALTVDLPEGAPSHLKGKTVTIGLLSDLHMGRLVSTADLDYCTELLARQRPDVMLIPGDLLDDHDRIDVAGIRKSLASIKAPMGIWGAVGNHEYHAGNIVKSIDMLKEGGVKVLMDNVSLVGNTFILVGRNDYSSKRLSGRERPSLAELIERLPAVYRNYPIIVMDHQPADLSEAEAVNAALQVSGHTHYGQIWPFNHVVSSLYENAYGHSTRGNTHYIVSAGAGTWGPPIRTTISPEVVVIRLTFK